MLKCVWGTQRQADRPSMNSAASPRTAVVSRVQRYMHFVKYVKPDQYGSSSWDKSHKMYIAGASRWHTFEVRFLKFVPFYNQEGMLTC